MKNVHLTLEYPRLRTLRRLLDYAFENAPREWYADNAEFIEATKLTLQVDELAKVGNEPAPGAEELTDEEPASHHSLSPREFGVMTRIAHGVSPATIARELGLSVKTVSTYRARTLTKMRMRSNAELAIYCERHNI
jgi:DNA-binding NarL/FixJ family response regulator